MQASFLVLVLERETVLLVITSTITYQKYINEDDYDMAGKVALNCFELMGRKGWKDDWFNFVCDTVLRRYLSSHEPFTELMEKVVKFVPNDIVARRYLISLTLYLFIVSTEKHS